MLGHTMDVARELLEKNSARLALMGLARSGTLSTPTTLYQ
jgi:hypothetical protein